MALTEPPVDADADADADAAADDDADPRMSDRFVRTSAGDDHEGTVVLVGVVHDHPSSVHRVGQITERIDPDVLALELPPLALPLFERYAEDERTPPVFGGEMSAAIQAAPTDRVVGVDGPTPGFVAKLLRQLLEERASRGTAATTLRGLASVTGHALVCRLAAAVSARTTVQLQVDSATSYDVDHWDDPAAQAHDERRQVRKATSVLQAFGTTTASRLRDTTRETHMAARLADLRSEGDVVAVVGVDHLEAVFDCLE